MNDNWERLWHRRNVCRIFGISYTDERKEKSLLSIEAIKLSSRRILSAGHVDNYICIENKKSSNIYLTLLACFAFDSLFKILKRIVFIMIIYFMSAKSVLSNDYFINCLNQNHYISEEYSRALKNARCNLSPDDFQCVWQTRKALYESFKGIGIRNCMERHLAQCIAEVPAAYAGFINLSNRAYVSTEQMFAFQQQLRTCEERIWNID